MKRKNLFGIVLMTSMGLSTAFADTCEPTASSWDSSLSSEQCATVATGVVTAAGSGIYSIKKYSEAVIYEEKYRKILFDNNGKRAVMSSMDGQKLVSQMTDGGKVVFVYELNEVRNREYYVKVMREKMNTAIAKAENARTLSWKYFLLSNQGNKSERAKASLLHEKYNTKANKFDSLAREFSDKSLAARTGYPVPNLKLQKVIEVDSGTKNLAQDFIDESAKNNNKITKITRLPVNNFRVLKSIIKKSRAGAVGIAAGVLFAGEELISGSVAEELEENNIPFKIDLTEGN